MKVGGAMAPLETRLWANRSRGSHLHRLCRTICDRDQDQIKRSRMELTCNQEIKTIIRRWSKNQAQNKHLHLLHLQLYNHQKTSDSRTTKACKLYQMLWSVGAYTASVKALRRSIDAVRDPSGFQSGHNFQSISALHKKGSSSPDYV